MTGLGRWMVGQAAAAVGTACVALHVVTALGPGQEAAWTRALLLSMACGCLACIREIRRTPTRRAWAVTGGMYAGMLGAHLLILTVWSSDGGMSHSMVGGLTWTDLGMWGGVALALVQVTLVAVALLAHLEVAGPAGADRRRRALDTRSAGSG